MVGAELEALPIHAKEDQAGRATSLVLRRTTLGVGLVHVVCLNMAPVAE